MTSSFFGHFGSPPLPPVIMAFLEALASLGQGMSLSQTVAQSVSQSVRDALVKFQEYKVIGS